MTKWVIGIILGVIIILFIGTNVLSAQNSNFNTKMSELVERNDLTASIFGSLFVNCASGVGGCELKRAVCYEKEDDRKDEKNDRANEQYAKKIQKCEVKKDKSLAKSEKYRSGCELDESCLLKADDKVQKANEKYDSCLVKAEEKRVKKFASISESYEKRIERCDTRAESCDAKVIKRCLKK